MPTIFCLKKLKSLPVRQIKVNRSKSILSSNHFFFQCPSHRFVTLISICRRSFSFFFWTFSRTFHSDRGGGRRRRRRRRWRRRRRRQRRRPRRAASVGRWWASPDRRAPDAAPGRSWTRPRRTCRWRAAWRPNCGTPTRPFPFIFFAKKKESKRYGCWLIMSVGFVCWFGHVFLLNLYLFHDEHLVSQLNHFQWTVFGLLMKKKDKKIGFGWFCWLVLYISSISFFFQSSIRPMSNIWFLSWIIFGLLLVNFFFAKKKANVLWFFYGFGWSCWLVLYVGSIVIFFFNLHPSDDEHLVSRLDQCQWTVFGLLMKKKYEMFLVDSFKVISNVGTSVWLNFSHFRSFILFLGSPKNRQWFQWFRLLSTNMILSCFWTAWTFFRFHSLSIFLEKWVTSLFVINIINISIFYCCYILLCTAMERHSLKSTISVFCRFVHSLTIFLEKWVTSLFVINIINNISIFYCCYILLCTAMKEYSLKSTIRVPSQFLN